jgi:hypothetical protein
MPWDTVELGFPSPPRLLLRIARSVSEHDGPLWRTAQATLATNNEREDPKGRDAGVCVVVSAGSIVRARSDIPVSDRQRRGASGGLLRLGVDFVRIGEVDVDIFWVCYIVVERVLVVIIIVISIPLLPG